jgi:hypothetical protein
LRLKSWQAFLSSAIKYLKRHPIVASSLPFQNQRMMLDRIKVGKMEGTNYHFVVVETDFEKNSKIANKVAKFEKTKVG